MLSLGQFLLLCLCSVDCVTTVTITRQLTNFTIMLWLSICPSHLLSVYRLRPRYIMPAILDVPDETPAMKDAIMGEEVKKRRLTRRKSAAGERGSLPPSGDAEAGGRGGGSFPWAPKKKPVAFCKNTTQLMGIIIKQCLRTEQDTWSLSAVPSSTQSSWPRNTTS